MLDSYFQNAVQLFSVVVMSYTGHSAWMFSELQDDHVVDRDISMHIFRS